MGRAHRLPDDEHAGGAAEESPRAHDRRDPGPEQARRRGLHRATTRRFCRRSARRPRWRSTTRGSFLSLIQKNKQLLDTKEQLERKLRDLSLLFELERATARATTHRRARAGGARAGGGGRATRAGRVLRLADDETGDLVDYVYDRERPGRARRASGARRARACSAARCAKASRSLLCVGAAILAAAARRGPLAFPVDVGAGARRSKAKTGALGAIGVFSSRRRSRARRRGRGAACGWWRPTCRPPCACSTRAGRASASERLTSIGRLLSQVIHDFKTPMTVISGYVQLMADADERRAAARVQRADPEAVRRAHRACSARCSSSRAASAPSSCARCT